MASSPGNKILWFRKVVHLCIAWHARCAAQHHM
jgi:hypothetical protein